MWYEKGPSEDRVGNTVFGKGGGTQNKSSVKKKYGGESKCGPMGG